MAFGSQLKIVAGICIGTALTELIYHFLVRYNERKKKNSLLRSGTLKTWFFPDTQVACKEHFISRNGCTNQRCKFSHDPQSSYGQLLRFLSSARVSVEVCVYTITGYDLSDILIDLHNKGVIVKVITDGEQQNSSGSQVHKFREAGIQVRMDHSSFFMHHKFALVDGQTLLNGSFNWTRAAVTGNHENLLVTNCPELLLKYKSEFEKLWKLYDPKLNK